MGQRIVAILMLLVIGVIIADLVLHPQGTATIANGISSIWKSGVQGAAGQQVT